MFGHNNPAATILHTFQDFSTLAPRPLIIHPSPLTTQLQAACHGTDPLIHRSHSLMDSTVLFEDLFFHFILFYIFFFYFLSSSHWNAASPSPPPLIPKAPCADGGVMFDKQQVLFVHSRMPLHADVGFPGHRHVRQRRGPLWTVPRLNINFFSWGSRAHLDASKGIS